MHRATIGARITPELSCATIQHWPHQRAVIGARTKSLRFACKKRKENHNRHAKRIRKEIRDFFPKLVVVYRGYKAFFSICRKDLHKKNLHTHREKKHQRDIPKILYTEYFCNNTPGIFTGNEGDIYIFYFCFILFITSSCI
ncbi:hypothetical protein V6Z11_A05G441100 [Gossypium hirsutum]